MEANKKTTKSDLERRMRNAVVLVAKDKFTKSVYFDDKGLRLTVTDEAAVVATGFHQHVFAGVTSMGISRPYTFVQQLIDIALENDCIVKDAKGQSTRSFAKLKEALNGDETKKADYNVVWYIEKWLFNIFAPLYSIGDSEADAFLVYESYLHNIARNHVILEEHTEDITNVKFVDEVIVKEKMYMDGANEYVIFKAKTDEERKREEIEALEQDANEKVMEQNDNNG